MDRALKLLLAMLLGILLTGCAGVAERELPAKVADSTDRTDSDLFYYVGAAEIYGMREEFAEAAGYYQKAAALSDDPEIAARAVRVATFAKDRELMLAGAQRWLALDSTNLEAHRIVASLLLARGDAEQAWPHVETLLERGDPSTSWEVLKELLTRSPDRAAALAVYQRVRELPAPLELVAVQRLSDLGLALGDVDGARHYTDLAIEMEPGEAKSWAWRGRLRRMQGDLEGAVADLAQAVKLDPDDSVLRRAYAELLAEQEDYSAALAQLDQVENDMQVLFSKAVYALRAEQPQRVKAAYQQMQDLAVEDSDEKNFFLGQLAESIDRSADEVLSWYRQVRSGERVDDARLRSAIVLAEAQRMDEAQAILGRLQNGSADIASRAFIAEGVLLQQNEQLEEALAVYHRGLKILPDNVELLFTRGLLAEQLDDLELAEADLRKVIELEPENVNAMNALGYTLADRTDRYEDALVLIEQALEREPNSAAIVDSMGWVQFKLGNYDEAIEYLERALQLQFDQEIAAHLGEVLWTVGRRDDAAAIWSRALEKAPDSEVILATRARLIN